jgi:hypothetical protein
VVERAARFRTRYTPTDDAMLRKNTIIESMALPMNAPAWAGLGMMKPKIKMRMSSVHSHLGMHLDCPPHASGARPCAGVVTAGVRAMDLRYDRAYHSARSLQPVRTRRRASVPWRAVVSQADHRDVSLEIGSACRPDGQAMQDRGKIDMAVSVAVSFIGVRG